MRLVDPGCEEREHGGGVAREVHDRVGVHVAELLLEVGGCDAELGLVEVELLVLVADEDAECVSGGGESFFARLGSVRFGV